MQPHVRVEAAGGAGQDGGGPRVQPGRVAHADLRRGNPLPGRHRLGRGHRAALDDDLQDRVAARFDVAVALHQTRNAIGGGDDDFSVSRLGACRRDVVRVELDQRVAGADRRRRCASAA
jgi:hypothetical protein